MPFLTQKGKFVVRNGKLVTTNNVDECSDCCDPPCGVTANSGGAGVTVKTYKMPSKAGTVKFFYDAFSIPDAFKVEGGGQVFIDTGSVQFSATRTFFKPLGLRSVTVTVTGPNGTGWTYTLGCPEDNPLP